MEARSCSHTTSGHNATRGVGTQRTMRKCSGLQSTPAHSNHSNGLGAAVAHRSQIPKRACAAT